MQRGGSGTEVILTEDGKNSEHKGASRTKNASQRETRRGGNEDAPTLFTKCRQSPTPTASSDLVEV